MKDKDMDKDKDKASAVVPAYPALPNSPDENQISMGLKGLKVSNKKAQGVQTSKKRCIKLTSHLKVHAIISWLEQLSKSSCLFTFTRVQEDQMTVYSNNCDISYCSRDSINSNDLGSYSLAQVNK